MIKKTKSYQFLKYMAFFKKERFELFDEENKTKINSIQDKINSLQDSLKLFNIKFINKLTNYIRYLDNQRDKEKIKNLSLLKKKLEYQNKIEQINSEIEKIQVKKNHILKWIYLQMRVKEKKLNLPNFYKTIFESNKEQILSIQQKLNENNNSYLRDSKELRKDLNRSGSSKKKKLLSKKSFSNLNNDNNILYKSVNKIYYNSNNSKQKIKVDINNRKEYITKEIFDKVLFWKYSPIFKTFDDFIDSLKDLDTQNIYLLKYYNQIQSKIYDSLKELRKIINFREKSDIIENQIKEKTKDLDKIKNKYKSIYKIYSKIKEENKNKKSNINESLSYNSNNKENKISFKNIDKIKNKINIIFEHCKSVNNKNLLVLLDYNIKKTNTKEAETIYILEYIECTIDFLTERINYYKRDENKNKLLQKIIIEIDKKHKQEKPDKQRLEDLAKSLKLLQKLESKNKKIFKLNKKVDFYSYNMKNKNKSNKNEDNKKKDDFPTLEEFLKSTNTLK